MVPPRMREHSANAPERDGRAVVPRERAGIRIESKTS
jgi:hypothetical protein